MLFFFANMWPEDNSRGITKKVFAQIKAFNNLGHTVKYYTGYKEDGAAVYDASGNAVYFRKFPTNNKLIHRILRNNTLKRMTYEFLRNTDEKFEDMYFRYLFFDPISRKMFREARKHSNNIVLEMHSYPNYNKGQYELYPVFLIDRLFRKSVLCYIDKLVAICSYKNIFGKETINIDNGIDLEGISPHADTYVEGQLRVVSVAYEWLAHGYDRLIRGLAEYYNNPNHTTDIKIVLVGTVMDSTKNLIHTMSLDDKVECVGIKKGKELDEIYDNSDIGVGLIGGHRTNSADSSGLKTKEYIAKGIPFFFSGEPLFRKEEFPFAFQIPANDSPVPFWDIVQFYNNIRLSYDNIPQMMREWAKEYTWEKELGKAFTNYSN